ncbi:hypothetical protein IWQ49_006434 [Labrenzia sp. EL_126]|nr:hypothetical protein [Labrenzia sp. EL_126]
MIKKTEIKIPLVTWRDGRPRFFPAPDLRKDFGLKGEDLRHPDGSWLSIEETIAWSNAKQEELRILRNKTRDATPATRKRAAATLAKASGLPTLAHLITDFVEKNPRMNGKEIRQGKKVRRPLAASTAQGYRETSKLIEQLEDGRFWQEIAAALTPSNMGILIDRVEVHHGLSQARRARSFLSQVFKYAIKNNKAHTNPITHLEESLPVAPPRVRYGEIDEMRILVEACDTVGRPEIGDIITQGLWFGQRQADRLNLTHDQVGTLGALFRQQKKHGQPLLLPVASAIEKRQAAAQKRRKDWRVNWPHVNLDERQRRPFLAKHYQHIFREICIAAAFGIWQMEDGTLASPLPADYRIRKFKLVQVTAAKGIPAGKPVIPPTPSLEDFRDQDLRDTAVTWLALAGCDDIEIASITGHSLKSVKEVMKHYLGMHPDLARRAIGKLTAWYEGAKG